MEESREKLKAAADRPATKGFPKMRATFWGVPINLMLVELCSVCSKNELWR